MWNEVQTIEIEPGAWHWLTTGSQYGRVFAWIEQQVLHLQFDSPTSEPPETNGTTWIIEYGWWGEPDELGISSVGNAPFPEELHDTVLDELNKLINETHRGE